MADWRLVVGDCRTALAEMAADSVDAVVCDPPYFLNFMNKGWDKANPKALDCDGLPGTRGHGREPGESSAIARENCRASQLWHETWAREALRVLKPGGFLVSMAGDRTEHRLTCALEDAGFEIRQKGVWLHAQGFPKNLNVSRELLALPWCACRGGEEAGARAVDPVPTDEGLAALGADAGVLCDGSGVLSGVVGREGIAIETALPAFPIGAGMGAEPVALPTDGLAADLAGGLGDELRGGAGHRGSAMKIEIEHPVRDFDPVMLGPPDMAIVAESHQVVRPVGLVEDEPESLRDQVVDDEVVPASAIGADPISLDDGGRDVLPPASFVRPIAAAPGGIAVGAEAVAIGNGHAGAGTVDGGGAAFGDEAPELLPADGAGKGGRAALADDGSGSSSGEGGGTGAGAVFGLPVSGTEGDAAPWAGFGKHEAIIRSLITENKVSVCAECGQPERPAWIKDGIGTALKPSLEFWVLARKPLVGSVAENVLRYGVGGINVDGCRVGLGGERAPSGSGDRRNGMIYAQDEWTRTKMANGGNVTPANGRWPPNTLLTHHPDCLRLGTRRVKASGSTTQGGMTRFTQDGANHPRSGFHPGYADAGGTEETARYACVPECPVRLLDDQAGPRSVPGPYVQRTKSENRVYGAGLSRVEGRATPHYGDEGGPSRFFPTFAWAPGEVDEAVRFRYVPKASRRERNAGLEGMPERAGGVHDDDAYRQPGERKANHTAPLPVANHHPTVKPVALMRWLCRLVTPPRGTILDPFLGSGSTGMAAILEGFAFVGIEQDESYAAIAERRIAHVARHGERWLEMAGKPGRSAVADADLPLFAGLTEPERA